MKKEVRHIKNSSDGAGNCSKIPVGTDVREAAAKELSALACEVGRIQQRIAALKQLLKAA